MRRVKAFTLVELLVVVLIIGALATIAIPRIGTTADTAKTNACQANVNMINRQAELFFANTGEWPQNWNKFKDKTDYFPDGPPQCPFGDTFSMSGGTHRINPHNH